MILQGVAPRRSFAIALRSCAPPVQRMALAPRSDEGALGESVLEEQRVIVEQVSG